MRHTDLKNKEISRLRQIAQQSAHEQAKMCEAPTLPESELSKEWERAEHTYLEKELDAQVPYKTFKLYLKFLLEAFAEENERLFRLGKRAD